MIREYTETECNYVIEIFGECMIQSSHRFDLVFQKHSMILFTVLQSSLFDLLSVAPFNN